MSKEAMKQALEAMQYADACLKKQLTTKTKHEYAQDLLLKAGKALEVALAKQEQGEPVAKFSDIVSDAGFDPRNQFDATPQQHKPLTDEQCDAMRAECSVFLSNVTLHAMYNAAHGIKE